MKTFDLRRDIKKAGIYFLLYVVSFAYWEIMLKVLTGNASEGLSFFFLFFIPAEAAAFLLFSGFHKDNSAKNQIAPIIILSLMWVYYSGQLLYHKQFGSFFSVDMIKMGAEAATNFWWAFKDTLIKGIPSLLIMFLPVAVSIAFIFIPKGKAHLSVGTRIISPVLTVVLWLLAILCIRAFGTDRTSPYYAFSSSYSDTDSSVEKLGATTTSLVEAGVYFFGVKGEENENIDVPISFVPVELPMVTEDTGRTDKNDNSEGDREIEPEEIPDEVIVPSEKYHCDANIDFEYLKSIAPNDTIKSICEYMAGKAPAKENEYTGMFEGYNLIYICGESFASQALNEKVTPLLCKMADSSIVLSNYYNSFKNTTTNGEFAFCTSLWPDVSRKAANGNAVGSFACSATNYMPYGLGNIFANIDVPSYAFHGYISSYYRRCDSWPNLGYQNMKFMKEGLTFKNKWSPADLELMEQTVDDFTGEDRFFTYYMTYSGHGAYTTATYMYIKNNAAVRKLLGDDAEKYTDSQISYLCGNYELELAINYLVDKLKEAGKLDNTLIVLAGDHIPYNLSFDEIEDFSKKNGMNYDKSFELYHSTCIIYNSAITEPIVNDEYCCTVDILPTVLNLMGIDYDSRMIAGIDVFDSGIHRARIYNGNLITKYVKYNASSGKAKWINEGSDFSDEQKKEYLKSLLSYSDSEYAVSLKMMDCDFYRFVWDNK